MTSKFQSNSLIGTMKLTDSISIDGGQAVQSNPCQKGLCLARAFAALRAGAQVTIKITDPLLVPEDMLVDALLLI